MTHFPLKIASKIDLRITLLSRPLSGGKKKWTSAEAEIQCQYILLAEPEHEAIKGDMILGVDKLSPESEGVQKSVSAK